MARAKNEVLTNRTTAEVKALLKLAAERERRSVKDLRLQPRAVFASYLVRLRVKPEVSNLLVGVMQLPSPPFPEED